MLYTTYISNIKNLSEDMQKKVIIIARYFKSEKFKKDIRLCPSAGLLKDRKDGLDWYDFEYFFKKEMKEQPMLGALRELYKRLKHGEDIILACYEKDDSICHRRLIGEFLSQYGIEYKEIEGVM